MVAVVLEQDSKATPDELAAFLAGRVSRWWLPERWAIVDEVPKTSVGKFDKKVLRSRYAEGTLEIVDVAPPTGELSGRPTSSLDLAEPSRSRSVEELGQTPGLDRLRESGDAVRAGETPDAVLAQEERRITRARRAVEKAVVLLGGPAPGGPGPDDGP